MEQVGPGSSQARLHLCTTACRDWLRRQCPSWQWCSPRPSSDTTRNPRWPWRHPWRLAESRPASVSPSRWPPPARPSAGRSRRRACPGPTCAQPAFHAIYDFPLFLTPIFASSSPPLARSWTALRTPAAAASSRSPSGPDRWPRRWSWCGRCRPQGGRSARGHCSSSAGTPSRGERDSHGLKPEGAIFFYKKDQVWPHWQLSFKPKSSNVWAKK